MQNVKNILPELIGWSEAHACPSHYHGVGHWHRVAAFGQELCRLAREMQPGDPYYEEGEVNSRVVLLFAYLHDSCRQDDGYDLEHGPRAAETIPEIRHSLLAFLSDREFLLLQRAIREHTASRTTDCLTVNLCLDSDRLDLGRVGITPDPEQMASKVGAMMAAGGR